MNAEVSKSRAQQQELYEELGKDMFESWSDDHASEVLTPEQYQSWKNEEEQSKNFLHNKMLKNKISDDSCR
jgi:23S rRNA G2445 N2-methylase RlmL